MRLILDKQNRFRILHIITGGGLGGAQTHLYYLVSQSKHYFDLHIAMGSRGHLWDKLIEQNVRVFHIPSMGRNIHPLRDLVTLHVLIGLIGKVKPHMICAHSSKAGLLGRLAARACGVPVVFTAHGWSFSNNAQNIQKKAYILAERMAARWSDKIICVSDYDRRLAMKYNVGEKDQLITVHNGIPDLSDKKYIAVPGKKNPVKLIMVARFREPKDYPLFLKVLGAIQNGEAFEVDLVGDGPLLEECKQRAYRSGLGNKVNFLGARTDVPELLARAQVFVLVSKWEGFPVSILEAMRAGLPVVASDVGGIKEAVIDGRTGILVPRDDEGKLREGLRVLIKDPNLRVKMGRNGRERFLKYFTLEEMFSKTASVYARVLPDTVVQRTNYMR